MRDANINVIMISQASSEHSVCFAVKMDDADKAVEVLRHRFRDAMGAGRISMVRSIDNCCVLAAVGSLMASRRGVAATMFSALAKSNVNIRCAPNCNAAIMLHTPPYPGPSRKGALNTTSLC